MSYRLIIRAEAEADLTDASAWYDHRRAGLGDELLAELDSVFERIIANPRQYTRLRRRPEVRRALTKRFPFRIFFVLRTNAIVVFRVLHTARDDREWRNSIPDKGD